MNYKLAIAEGKIYFENNSANFVEVVFTVNGRDIKYNKPFSNLLRGYCYPGGYKRNIKDFVLPVTGEVKAYIYNGTGEYSYADSEVPPFIRFKINEIRKSEKRIGALVREKVKQKVIFNRSSNSPIATIKLIY